VEVQVLQILVVEALRGRSDAVGAVTVADLIQIHLQNLVLGEAALDLDRQGQLLDLAAEGLALREVDLARELHGDGRPALFLTTLGHFQVRDLHQPDRVETAMRMETLVLDRDGRVPHHLGHVHEVYEDPVFLIEDPRDLLTVRRVQDRRRPWLVVPDVRPAGDDGQDGSVGSVGCRNGSHADDE